MGARPNKSVTLEGFMKKRRLVAGFKFNKKNSPQRKEEKTEDEKDLLLGCFKESFE